MAEFPLLVRFRTDDYHSLVPVDSEDTVSEAAGKVTHVVDSRVRIDHDRDLEVIFEGERLPNDELISDVVDPVDYVEVQYAGTEIPEGYGDSHPAWTERSMLEAHPEHAKPTK